MKRIFGLDYGRGTMAGFYVDEDAEVLDPHAIMDSHGEPSGFTVMDDGSTRVGLTMYNIGSKDLCRIKEYHVNVKEKPLGDERSDALQIRYARAWRERIIEKNPQLFNDGYEEHWFIGCPTGWRSKKTVDDYAKIFTAAGFKNVVIVPESNAAMMYAEQAYGFVKDVDEKVGVLCVDLGAYSADSTYVRPGKSVASYGGYVGASLIEKMIVTENFKDEYRTADQPYVTSGVLRAIRDEYGKNEKFRTNVLIAARKLKESYYSSLAEGNDFSDIDCTVQIRLDETVEKRVGVKMFTIYVNDLMTKAIIHERPVRTVLGDEFGALPDEVRKELGDKSWEAGLEAFLTKTLEICPDFAAAARAGDKKACLIVTGGASLMPFVQDTIGKVMPNATLYKDSDPMSTIAKGLVYFGPEKLKAMAFDKEFERLLTLDIQGNAADPEKHNDVLNTFASRAHDVLAYGFVFERKGELFTPGCSYDLKEESDDMGIVFRTVDKMVLSVVDAASDWGNGSIESGQVASRALAKFKEWFDGSSDKSMSAVQTKTVEFVKKFLSAELNAAFASLLRQYKLGETLLSSSELTLEYANLMFEWWRDQYEKVFKPQIDDEDSFYRNFPNPGVGTSFVNGLTLGIVGTTRQVEYNSRVEIFKARNGGWWEKDRADFMDVVNKPENYGPFKLNCLEELNKAIKKAKKTKLGDLIVEESFDDDVVTPEVFD